jgi:hypothetical protein
MITLIYHIKPEERDTEIEWLRAQKVYPSVQDGWDFKSNQATSQFGVIVPPETALSIKLRHKLDYQEDYRQR